MFIILIISSFIITLILLKPSIHLANRLNLIDIPEERKIHKTPTPRAGGVAIFFGYSLSLALTQIPLKKTIPLIAAGFLIFLCGLIDDKKRLSAWKKLFWQLVSASIVIIWGGVKFHIGNPALNFLNNNLFSIMLTYFWIIGVINAINLIDGMDGLAGGISIFSFGAIILISFLKGYMLPLTLSSILLGSTLAFLNFNLPVATIFLGDSGSLFLGFNIAVLSLMVSYKTGAVISIIFPSLFVLIPVADTIFAFTRRLLQGKNPLTNPDKGHIHHRLLLLKFSPNQALIIFYFFSGVFTTIAVSLKSKTILSGIIISLAMTFLLFLLLYIFERKSVDRKIEKFNRFTNRLKQRLRDSVNLNSKTMNILNSGILIFYILMIVSTYLTKNNEQIFYFIFLLFAYITMLSLIILFKIPEKIFPFVEFWFDFALIYFAFSNKIPFIPVVIISILFPFFLYRVIKKRIYIALIPQPVDIFLFFVLLNLYLIQSSLKLPEFSIPFLAALLYIYKKTLIMETEKQKKEFYYHRLLVSVLFFAILLFKLKFL